MSYQLPLQCCVKVVWVDLKYTHGAFVTGCEQDLILSGEPKCVKSSPASLNLNLNNKLISLQAVDADHSLLQILASLRFIQISVVPLLG